VTADKVVDASAFAAVTFLEPGFAAVKARLHGGTLCAPALLRFEMANVCIKKLRAIPLERDLLLARYRGSFRIQIQEHEVNHREVVDLAERQKLTAYDASYLWLAKRLNCEVVTLDARLQTARRVYEDAVAAARAASSRARWRSISFTHQIEISYRRINGTISVNGLMKSGGVRIAATTVMARIA
jgi:predicted nucleic acid-binding protein